MGSTGSLQQQLPSDGSMSHGQSPTSRLDEGGVKSELMQTDACYFSHTCFWCQRCCTTACPSLCSLQPNATTPAPLFVCLSHGLLPPAGQRVSGLLGTRKDAECPNCLQSLSRGAPWFNTVKCAPSGAAGRKRL